MKRKLAAALTVLLLAAAAAGSQASYTEVPIPPTAVRTVVNPYGVAPLSALLIVSASAGINEADVHRVEVSITDAQGTLSWSLPYGSPQFEVDFDTSGLPGVAGDDIVIPVLGLQPDTATEVSVKVFDDAGHRACTYGTTIVTHVASDNHDPLRDGFPEISISTAIRSRMEPGMTLVSFSMGNNGRFTTRPFVIDAAGTTRWLLRLDALRNWASPVERLENGNLLLGRGGFVYEYSMLGRQVNAWDIGRYGFTQHHDIFEIRTGPHRGDLLVAVDRIGADTVEDFVIEIDRRGKLVDTWDMRQALDVTRSDLLKNPRDWLHMNAVLYDPRDDSIIVSGRNQGVFKVDREHRLRWILAPHRGWGASGVSGAGPNTSDSLLTAVSPDGIPYPPEVQLGRANVDDGHTFDWPWGQHAIGLLENGDLFLFDNGFNRLFKGQKAGSSRAVEYRIDEEARTVQQVWEYGGDRGSDYYSDIISDVDTLPLTKNRLVTSGSVRHSSGGPHAYVTEISYPDDRVVFEARIGFLDAHSNLKAGGWGNMDIVYRAERMALYPGIAARRN